MKKDNNYFICRSCGNIFSEIGNKDGSDKAYCGGPLEQLTPGTSDGAVEKHVPYTRLHDNILEVKIGSQPHPMTPAHYIQWISVVTDRGHQLKFLKPGESPEATFIIPESEKVQAVYAYCNLHELWVKKG